MLALKVVEIAGVLIAEKRRSQMTRFIVLSVYILIVPLILLTLMLGVFSFITWENLFVYHSWDVLFSFYRVICVIVTLIICISVSWFGDFRLIWEVSDD